MSIKIWLGVVLLLVAGCGSSKPAAPDTSGPLTEPITPGAVAAVVLEFLPDNAARGDLPIDENHQIGAQLRYAKDSYHTVTATVEPRATAERPCVSRYDGCVQLEEGIHLAWQKLQEEEDPGMVYIRADKADSVVIISYAYLGIEKDPREIKGIEPSIKEMVTIAKDRRLGLKTTSAAIQAGKKVSFKKPT